MCEGDPALRQRLEALLAAHAEPDKQSPKGAPAVIATIKLDLPDAPGEAVGQTLGRYKLLERLGEGGCGVVYVAEQTEGAVIRGSDSNRKSRAAAVAVDVRDSLPGLRLTRRHGKPVSSILKPSCFRARSNFDRAHRTEEADDPAADTQPALPE
jgi:hypothetical protein